MAPNTSESTLVNIIHVKPITQVHKWANYSTLQKGTSK